MSRSRLQQIICASGLTGILLVLGSQPASAKSFQSMAQPNVPNEATVDVIRTTPLETSVSLTEVAPSDSVETSAATLQVDSPTVQPTQATSEVNEPGSTTTVAQAIAPGRATRSGPSYIAVGGNIGFGGSSGIGRGNFAATSKVGLTRNFSARPGILVGDRTTVLLPVTVDFPTATVIDEGRLGLAPFIGGGVGISTGDNSRVRPIITAGVDVPITSRLTAVASTNIGFFNNAEVGLLLGIGYNF